MLLYIWKVCLDALIAVCANNFICNEDLYLSKDHAILINNEYFIMAKDLPFAKQVTNLTCEEYEYFHIITENYLTDTIISNGLPTESFGCNLPKHIIPYIYKNKVNMMHFLKEHHINHHQFHLKRCVLDFLKVKKKKTYMTA